MDTRKRAKLAIVGGIFCAVVGPLLGGTIYTLVSVAGGLWQRQQDVWTVAAFLPVVVLYAAIAAAPFGFIVGSIGSWWLVARVASTASARRVYCESGGVGALLGATFPPIEAVLGWGPFRNLLSSLPISIGTGIICGVALAASMRTYIRRLNRSHAT